MNNLLVNRVVLIAQLKNNLKLLICKKEEDKKQELKFKILMKNYEYNMLKDVAKKLESENFRKKIKHEYSEWSDTLILKIPYTLPKEPEEKDGVDRESTNNSRIKELQKLIDILEMSSEVKINLKHHTDICKFL